MGALISDGSPKRLWARWRGRSRARRTVAEKLCLLVALLALSLTFLSSLAPVTAWDAGVAHLALAARYATVDRIGFELGNNYCAYPQLMQTLFAVALKFRTPPSDSPGYNGFAETEHLAGMMAWLFAVLACAAAYALGERLGGRTCGAIAGANLAATPIFADQASAPLIDLAFTATVLAALWMALAWHEERRWGRLALAAAIAGSGCGIRHTGYLVIALIAMGIAMASPKRGLLAVPIFICVALLSASPWLWHSWRVTGDPVYPFFASRFSNGLLPDVDVAAIGTHSSLQGTSVPRLIAFPWSLTMNPAHYGGWATSPGAVWLVLGLIGVIAGGGRARAVGAFSGAGIASIFLFQRFARYAFPFIAPMMAVAALPFEKLPKLRPLIAASLGISYALGVAPALANAYQRLPVVVGKESRDEYLSARVERYAAMDWIAQNAPFDAKVLSVDPRGYYFNREVYSNFEALKWIASLDDARQRLWLMSRPIKYVFYPEAYVARSPAFRETGVGAMLDAWRADTAHFVLIKDFDLADPRGGGRERVEIYEFRP
jgi:4-amino-4-deoxy-L-arabinose transferase-like glycosyltransferase